MSKNILVTGAAGLIGSHVAQALLALGDSVVGLDNLNDYYDPARKRANLSEIRNSNSEIRNFHFIKGDIRDRALISRLFTEYRFDAIVHLAAMAGVRVSIKDPAIYYDVNLNGTLVLFDAAVGRLTSNLQRANLPTFVFASTSSVYGLRGRPDMMAYKVAENIYFGREVPLYNIGQMYRDWACIDDIVKGVLAAVDRPLGYDVINLGRGEPVLLADFVRFIEELTGRNGHLVPPRMPEDDIPYTYADISKARRLLGYNPTISVQEGMAHFLEWYEKAVLGGNKLEAEA